MSLSLTGNPQCSIPYLATFCIYPTVDKYSIFHTAYGNDRSSAATLQVSQQIFATLNLSGVRVDKIWTIKQTYIPTISNNSDLFMAIILNIYIYHIVGSMQTSTAPLCKTQSTNCFPSSLKWIITAAHIHSSKPKPIKACLGRCHRSIDPCHGVGVISLDIAGYRYIIFQHIPNCFNTSKQYEPGSMRMNSTLWLYKEDQTCLKTDIISVTKDQKHNHSFSPQIVWISFGCSWMQLVLNGYKMI